LTVNGAARTYDANGHLTNAPGQTLTWNGDNRLEARGRPAAFPGRGRHVSPASLPRVAGPYSRI
jgi:hypothetical protein